MALAQVLSHNAILQVAKPCTLLEVVLRQEHVPQTQLLRTLLQVFQNGRVRVEAGLDAALAQLLRVDGIGGDAFFFDELFDLSTKMEC